MITVTLDTFDAFLVTLYMADILSEADFIRTTEVIYPLNMPDLLRIHDKVLAWTKG
jgi:hypothetical protein